MNEFYNKILVVGGAGFIGSNLVRALVEFPAEIVIVDNLLSSEKENIPASPRICFWEGSITSDRILAKIRDEYTYIFHLATYHGNQNSIHNPLTDHDNNVLTTLKLYNHVKKFKVLRKLVYASAGCVVAEKTFREAHATEENQPVSLYLDSPYQISKIVGEFYSNYYFKQFGLPVVKARFQNVYGQGEVLGAGKWRGTAATVWRNVTPTFIYRALKGLPLILEGGGTATRDFIHISDIVRGLLLCAVKGVPGEVYNLASGVETSISDLAKAIKELSGSESALESLPSREWDRSGKRFGSTEKASRELGFTAEVNLKDGLQTTIDWTRENIAFIEFCIGKHQKHLRSGQ